MGVRVVLPRGRDAGPLGIRVVLAPRARPGTSRVLEFDGDHVLGNFEVWPDGATEATLLDIVTGQPVYFDAATAAALSELDARFLAFLDACLKAEKPSP